MRESTHPPQSPSVGLPVGPREFFSAVLVPFFLFWVFFQLGALLVPGNDLPEVGVKSFKERVPVCVCVWT